MAANYAKRLKKPKLNNKGMATLEAIPMIVIFVMLVGYALGLWGVIHSATLHSIGARQYAFETLRHRANYMYLRDQVIGGVYHHEQMGYRYHAVTGTSDTNDSFIAPYAPITVGKKPVSSDLQRLNADNQAMHYNEIFDMNARNQSVEFSHAWIMTGYGICLNPQCGASGP